MRTGIRISVGAATVLLIAVSGPASATHSGIHPTFKENNAYFHCVGGDAMKIQNLNYPNPFDANAPTRSAADGAGCGMADPANLINTMSSGGPADSSFAGISTGNLKNMTVEMYLLGNYTYGPVTGDIELDVWLTIDGEEYLHPDAATVTPPLEETNSGATQKVEFTITGIGSAKDITDADGNVIDVETKGLATEDGDGLQEREIGLTVRMAGYVDYVASVWVFDTEEVPAGITFNDATPAATKLPVQI